MKLLNQQFFTILELDKEFAFELAKMFEDSTIDILEQFETSLDDLDKDQCKKLMHTAKGSAANFGAEELMETFKAVEKDVANLDKDNINNFKEKSHMIKNLLDKTLEEVNTHR